MVFRKATTSDIPEMQSIRHAVKENVLSNPALVTDKDCEEYLTVRGKGWVCEMNKVVVGFGIVDLKDKSIWALFLLPEYEKMGIGKKLHELMLDWLFTQTHNNIWLTTAPGTRAEGFYRKLGWKEAGRKENGEIEFEISYDEWMSAAAL